MKRDRDQENDTPQGMEDHYRLTGRSAMIGVLARVYEKHTRADGALKTEVRNGCWVIPEHPNGTKSFGPLLTTGKANYKLPLEKPFLPWHEVCF